MSELAGLTTHRKYQRQIASKKLRRGVILPTSRRWTSGEWEKYCATTTKAERRGFTTKVERKRAMA